VDRVVAVEVKTNTLAHPIIRSADARRGDVKQRHCKGHQLNYRLNRWTAFTRFLDDGRVCLTNNAAERALRGSFLKQTIEKFRRPKTGPVQFNVAEEITPEVWKDYWSAGQGVAAITEIVSVRALCE
jgi:hypothetical protein